MSELRTQLDQMRHAYRGSRYPGDLAAEIVSPTPPRKVRIDALAIAASLVIVVGAAYLVRLAFPPKSIELFVDVAMTVTPDSEFSMIPEFPSGLPLVPQAESLGDIGAMPSMPSMPSVDFTFDFSPHPAEDL